MTPSELRLNLIQKLVDESVIIVTLYPTEVEISTGDDVVMTFDVPKEMTRERVANLLGLTDPSAVDVEKTNLYPKVAG